MRAALALSLASATLLAGCHARTATPPVQHQGEEVEHLGGEPPGSPWRAYLATTPMAGRCRSGSCLSHGWIAQSSEGDVLTRCTSGDCGGTGWTTEWPDGTRSETQCRFKNCFREGWNTRTSGGVSVEALCNMRNCWKSGWSLKLQDGAVVQTRCTFGNCVREGWTSNVGGKIVTCRCRVDDCEQNGADCSTD